MEYRIERNASQLRNVVDLRGNKERRIKSTKSKPARKIIKEQAKKSTRKTTITVAQARNQQELPAFLTCTSEDVTQFLGTFKSFCTKVLNSWVDDDQDPVDHVDHVDDSDVVSSTLSTSLDFLYM